MLSSISCKVPKNTGDKRSGKSETSPVAPRAGIQQKAQQQQQQHKVNQALQVPAVSLYPSRKKVPVKDLPPFGKWNDEVFDLIQVCLLWQGGIFNQIRFRRLFLVVLYAGYASSCTCMHNSFLEKWKERNLGEHPANFISISIYLSLAGGKNAHF